MNFKHSAILIAITVVTLSSLRTSTLDHGRRDLASSDTSRVNQGASAAATTNLTQSQSPSLERSSICSTWSRNQEPILERLSDGSILPNPFMSKDQLRRPSEFRNLIQESSTDLRRIEDLNRIFASITDSMRSQIESQNISGGHSTYLLQRLSRLRFRVASSREEASNCNETVINATYDQIANEIVYCPLLTHMPAEAVLPLIAHELGHLADPCNELTYYRYSPTLASQNSPGETSNSLTRAVSSCLAQEPAAQVSEFLERARGPTRLGNRLMFINPGQETYRRLSDQMVRCGHFLRPELTPPNVYGNHPYFETISCVARTFPRADDYSHILTGVEVIRQQTPISNNSVIDSNSNICRSVLEQDRSLASLVKETVADHIGAQLLRFHLRRVGSLIPPDRRRFLDFYFQFNDCLDLTDPSYLPGQERRKIFDAAINPRTAAQLPCSIE